MTRYESYAQEIADAIEAGVFRAGDQLPSVREACLHRGVSPTTVFKAYYLLEAQGLIRAVPRSGYYVSAGVPQRPFPEPEPSRPVAADKRVDVSDLLYDMLTMLRRRCVVPLGSAFPDPALFPLERMRTALVSSLRRFDPWSTINDLPPGNQALKRQILKRYLIHGSVVADTEIVLTNGALPALHLCLEAVTQWGDSVVVESPCFYITMQALQRLGLKAIEVATDPREGIDLSRLAEVLERKKPAACWLMTNYQNPLGSLMPHDKKRDLVALLARHEIPLIEDDVYLELYQGEKAPLSAKNFDKKGLVLHCCSFSKTLAPGYRVGWAAAGRFAGKLERLKLMTFLQGSIPAQGAIATYLQDGGYDAHLRRLRQALAAQQTAVFAAVHRYFPSETRLSRPPGGYFAWLELPRKVDAMRLYHAAFAAGVSLAPGVMFSPRPQQYSHCIRINTGQQWTPSIDKGLATLGRLVAEHGAASQDGRLVRANT